MSTGTRHPQVGASVLVTGQTPTQFKHTFPKLTLFFFFFFFFFCFLLFAYLCTLFFIVFFWLVLFIAFCCDFSCGHLRKKVNCFGAFSLLGDFLGYPLGPVVLLVAFVDVCLPACLFACCSHVHMTHVWLFSPLFTHTHSHLCSTVAPTTASTKPLSHPSSHQERYGCVAHRNVR